MNTSKRAYTLAFSCLLLVSGFGVAQAAFQDSADQITTVLNSPEVRQAVPAERNILGVVRNEDNIVTIVLDGCVLSARVLSTDQTAADGTSQPGQVETGPLVCETQLAPSPSPSPTESPSPAPSPSPDGEGRPTPGPTESPEDS